MVSLPIFPTAPAAGFLPGQGWSVKKTPRFKTRKQESLAGRELRILDQPSPIWDFELTFDFLRDKHDVRQGGGLGLGFDELRTLMGFYLFQQGSFNAFWFDDPTDDTVVAQSIGTGTGSQTVYQLIRTMNGFNEPIIAPDTLTGRTLTIFLNGVATGTASVDNSTGLVTFSPAPNNGVAITASFSYYFLCRFSEDTQEFEDFMFQLWEAKTVKLTSLLL